ncbi:MAG: hypothetical protein KAW41_04185 [Candidatus Diapherotrites archaeon]|nr:hypothetical protein [Candidatus Diapherotrites archaeon]
MLLEMAAPPKEAEAKLLRLILPDFLLIFLILAVAGNVAVIYSGIVKFPQVLLLVPAICVLAAILAFVRFYGFLSTVLRSMGALSFTYDELGSGQSEVTVDFGGPILLFGIISGRGFQKSKAKGFSFFMKSDSAKYRAETSIRTDHTGYYLDINLKDWRGKSHARSARGKVPQLQTAMIQAINDLRTEVLESTGVKVSEIPVPKEAYKPVPKPVPKVVPKALPVPAPVPAEKPPEKPKPPAKPKVSAKERAMAPVAALPPVLEEKAVEEKTVEVKVEMGKAKTEAEKKALQDILFQLEEIDKVIKSD